MAPGPCRRVPSPPLNRRFDYGTMYDPLWYPIVLVCREIVSLTVIKQELKFLRHSHQSITKRRRSFSCRFQRFCTWSILLPLVWTSCLASMLVNSGETDLRMHDNKLQPSAWRYIHRLSLFAQLSLLRSPPSPAPYNPQCFNSLCRVI